MSECQKWPHIQTITKRGVPLRDCWEKMPWCQYTDSAGQGSNTITYLSDWDWYPVGHCPPLTVVHHPVVSPHNTTGHHPRVRIKRVGHTTSPPPVGPSSCPLQSPLYLLPDKTACAMLGPPARCLCCSTYCLSCNNISFHCLLPHQAWEEINFSLYLRAECNITIAPNISTTVFAHLTVRRVDHHNLVLQCSPVINFTGSCFEVIYKIIIAYSDVHRGGGTK